MFSSWYGKIALAIKAIILAHLQMVVQAINTNIFYQVMYIYVPGVPKKDFCLTSH